MAPADYAVAIGVRIADGTDIDWSSADTTLGATDDAALAANLKSIAALATSRTPRARSTRPG